MDKSKKPEIVFAPGCFDNIDITQEELDSLMAEISHAIESGEIFEKSKPLTEEEFLELPEEIQEQLINGLEDIDAEERKKRLN